MARILSGRYQSCWLRRHWDGGNGACRLLDCGHIPGDVPHIFSGSCPALSLVTEEAAKKLAIAVAPFPPIASLLTEVTARDTQGFTQFLLNPSTDPAAIQLHQAHGSWVWDKLFYLSRTWLFTLHRERYRLLGLSWFLV